MDHLVGMGGRRLAAADLGLALGDAGIHLVAAVIGAAADAGIVDQHIDAAEYFA